MLSKHSRAGVKEQVATFPLLVARPATGIAWWQAG